MLEEKAIKIKNEKESSIVLLGKFSPDIPLNCFFLFLAAVAWLSLVYFLWTSDLLFK